ncbi:ATP synthase F1 subunit gamma [Patescibacteria group bacterium]|nr:ATP synthase F1 subunit gamma [Patescibacteria group bacterium]MBU1931904.1 ATP synthase F1 subunit gamma [Patescibacteria group bacterium]
MSGKLRLIKRRVKSAQNIAQLTKAMEMVAASKMKRAQKQAIEAKPYADKVEEITTRVVSQLKKRRAALLKYYAQTKIKRHLVIFVTTNKGLCGSLNSNLFRKLFMWLTDRPEQTIDFITLGEKGQLVVLKSKYELVADFSNLSDFTQAVGSLMTLVNQGFTQGKYQAVWLVYNEYLSALKYVPRIKRLLPIAKTSLQQQPKSRDYEYLFEPSQQQVINKLLPFYLEIQIRDAILEAIASEHSARMMAMKNATDNAYSLVDGLTLEYNKVRQQAITAEISDITTAKISMEANS